MIELIDGMPHATLGFRVSEAIERADYVEVVLPAVHDALETHGRLRTLHELAPGVDEFDPRSLLAGVREVNTLGMEHLNRLERTAVATDEEWVRRAAARYAWLLPGEFKLFALAELAAAKAWVGDGS